MESISPELKNEVFRRKDQLELSKIQLIGNLLKQQLNTVETKTKEFVTQFEGVGYLLNSKQKEIN